MEVFNEGTEAALQRLGFGCDPFSFGRIDDSTVTTSSAVSQKEKAVGWDATAGYARG